MFHLLHFLLLMTNTLGIQVAHTAKTHFKIAFSEQIGALSFRRDKNGTIIGYAGTLMELFTWISSRMDFRNRTVAAVTIMFKNIRYTNTDLKQMFSFTIIPDTLRLDPLPNGTWSGVIGLLESKRVDLVFGAVPMASNIFRVADFTAAVREEPVVMLIPAPVEESRALALIKPFTLTVWLVLVAIFIAVTVSLCSFKRAERLVRNSTTDNVPSVGELVLCNIQLFLGQGGFSGPSLTTLAPRLTLAGWTFAVLIFVNSYTGSFISYATAPKLVFAADTVEDAAFRSPLQPVLTANAQLSILLNQTGDGPLKALGEKLRKNPNLIVPKLQDVVERVGSGCCVFIYPKAALELMLYIDLKRTGQCRCSITKTPVIWDYYVMATRKDAPLATNFSKQILWAKDVGLMEHWMQKSIKHPYKCLTPEPSKIRPITMKDLSGVFMILGAGVILSTTVFVFEVATSKMKKFRNIKRNANK